LDKTEFKYYFVFSLRWNKLAIRKENGVDLACATVRTCRSLLRIVSGFAVRTRFQTHLFRLPALYYCLLVHPLIHVAATLLLCLSNA